MFYPKLMFNNHADYRNESDENLSEQYYQYRSFLQRKTLLNDGSLYDWPVHLVITKLKPCSGP